MSLILTLIYLARRSANGTEMDPSLIAYSLSNLLITVALFYHKSTWAQLEDFCGQIDDDLDNTTELHGTTGILYLHSPACTGNITSWRVCYREPKDSLSDNELYSVKYAVYRRFSDTQSCYINQVSTDLNFTFTFNNITTYHRSDPDEENGVRDQCSENGHEYSEGILRCFNKRLETPLVQNDDIIATCVLRGIADHEDSKIMHVLRLNIYNRIEGQSIAESDVLLPDIDTCQRNASLPIMIDLSQFSPVKLRRLNLSANMCREYA